MYKKKLIKLLVALTFLFLGTAPSLFPVQADVGPIQVHTQGGLVDPNSIDTKVRMVREVVDLNYDSPKKEYFDNGEEMWKKMDCHVIAVFEMKNLSDEKESLKVFFPANYSFLDNNQAESISSSENKITNFKVNGVLLGEDRFIEDMKVDIGEDTQEISAFQWEEDFPPNKIKKIKVEYDTKSINQRSYSNTFRLPYVLGSGHDWFDSIKSGTVRFNFPYDLTPYSVITRKQNNLDMFVFDNTVLFEFEDYEPERDKVIKFGVYDPALTQEVESLRRQADSFWDYLIVADKVKTLANGVKCPLSFGPAEKLGREYYLKAIKAAESKEELLFVLESLVTRQSNIDSLGSIKEGVLYQNGMVRNFGMVDCDLVDEDEVCVDKVFGFRKYSLQYTAIGTCQNYKDNKELLTVLANRIKKYDVRLSEGIMDYVSYSESRFVKPTVKPTKSLPSPTEEAIEPQTFSANLLISLGVFLLVSIVGVVVLVRKNRRRNN